MGQVFHIFRAPLISLIKRFFTRSISEMFREKAAESLELEKFEFYLSPLKLFPESVVYRGICLVQLLGKAHTERGASVFERVILRTGKVEKSIIRIKKKIFIFGFRGLE